MCQGLDMPWKHHDCPFAWYLQIIIINVSSYVMGTALCLIPRPLPPPVTSILEFLQRGKAWRIWSHIMTSGRQTVDTQEAVDLRALSCNITGLEAKSICEAASIQFMPGIIMVRHHHPCVYHLPSCLTRSPMLPPLYLCTASDQRL